MKNMNTTNELKKTQDELKKMISLKFKMLNVLRQLYRIKAELTELNLNKNN